MSTKTGVCGFRSSCVSASPAFLWNHSHSPFTSGSDTDPQHQGGWDRGEKQPLPVCAANLPSLNAPDHVPLLKGIWERG